MWCGGQYCEKTQQFQSFNVAQISQTRGRDTSL
jgi:hypothetical protein